MEAAESGSAESVRQNYRSGAADIFEAFRIAPVWLLLGWYDFILQHRGTVIGPFWQTVQMSIWILGLGLVFGPLLGRSGMHYPVYLAAGLSIWNFISSILTGSPNLFVRNQTLIMAINRPIFLHALRNIVQQLIRLGFQLIVFVALVPFAPVRIGPQMLLAVPGLACLVIAAMWVSAVMGIIGTRYRDTQFAVGALMRFFFLATPVIWVAEGLGTRAYLAKINPFTHFLEVVRAPLLGEAPELLSWGVVLGVNALGVAAALILFHRYRRRVVFWL